MLIILNEKKITCCSFPEDFSNYNLSSKTYLKFFNNFILKIIFSYTCIVIDIKNNGISLVDYISLNAVKILYDGWCRE